MDLRGQAALVTGASRGIGAAIADRLAASAWDLTIAARTSAALAETEDRLTGPDRGEVMPVTTDLAVPDQVSALAAAHVQRFGRLDALILNAGMGSIGPFGSFPLRRLDKLLAVNVRAAYQLVQECLPALRQTAAASPLGARVIAVSSLTGIAGEPMNSAYGATKAALTSLCETLSAEESGGGVSGCAVCPGYVATDMTAGLHELVAPQDMIEVADVAEIVVALTRLSKAAVVPMVPITRPGPHLWRA